MTELLRDVISSRLADVHTSIPGRVVSYDASTQTADVEIVILRADQAETGEVVHEPYPVVPNVPVAWPSGGGYSLQLALTSGDGVWLVFSEAATANWRDTGDVSPPGDLDRHDLSYPIAIPGARHKGQTLPSTTSALLSVPGGGTFTVSSGGAVAAVPRDDYLQAELDRIKSDISTLKSAIVSGFNALVGAPSGPIGSPAVLAFNGDAAAVPTDPGSTASVTLKAQ